MPRSCSSAGSSDASTRWSTSSSSPPVLAEDGLEHCLLRREVVVEETVRDARLLGDVADPRAVVAAAREYAHSRGENRPPTVFHDD